MTASIAQINVRIDRALKEQGDAVLALAGSSPVKIIRQLWECLATDADAFERIMTALSPAPKAPCADEAQRLVAHSAGLFQELGISLGVDLPAFQPDLRPVSEILEEVEWGILEDRGLV